MTIGDREKRRLICLSLGASDNAASEEVEPRCSLHRVSIEVTLLWSEVISIELGIGSSRQTIFKSDNFSCS